jgi:GntR family transcriptional regulator/MocR family aminotransferase
MCNLFYFVIYRLAEEGKMKAFVPNDDSRKSEPLYIQLYRHIESEIMSGSLRAGEKLPSLRRMAESSGVSLTTASLAYTQLITEGYIKSVPRSGYFVAEIPGGPKPQKVQTGKSFNLTEFSIGSVEYTYDLSSFDFAKWKKCTSRVFNENPELLFFESDVQGEEALRFEISKYLYSSRGVMADPSQIVIGAGTQQLSAHLIRIMRRMNIGYVCTEDPGYLPIQQIFRDNGFNIGKIPVSEDGIMIEKLPANIRCAVYVSPANQFPTGYVMPVGNRYRLLSWAKDNDSLILEDDYDSELRYFGKPIPPLKSLDTEGLVVYLGSFSSTLFPAIKISYMILPDEMAKIFDSIKEDYTQTCSKTEQLALALFMAEGYYATGIKKLRSLYSQKLHAALQALSKYGKGFIETAGTRSGINMILKVKSTLTEDELCSRAKSLKINVEPLDVNYIGYKVNKKSESPVKALIFYYNQIPLADMDEMIRAMAESFRNPQKA